MARELRIELAGGGARLGRVPATDVAKAILGFQGALQRAANYRAGQVPKATGRRRRAIEDATRLRLIGVQSGSVVIPMVIDEVERTESTFELDIVSLGDLAVETVFSLLAGQTEGPPDVASALARVASDIGIGTRYAALRVASTYRGVSSVAVLDAPARDRLAALGEHPAAEPRPDVVAGVLVEADFEEHTARVRTPTDRAVSVVFDPEQADEVQQALRRPNRFEGEATVDPITGGIREVRLREIVSAPQLGFDVESFYRDVDIDELISQEGLLPLSDETILRASEPIDEKEWMAITELLDS